MAHEYRATINWTRNGAVFTDNKYSRGHRWIFDGIEVRGTPEVIGASSDLHFAAKEGFVVERYEDAALGVMTKNERGKLYISKVTLSPAVTFTGDKRPT